MVTLFIIADLCDGHMAANADQMILLGIALATLLLSIQYNYFLITAHAASSRKLLMTDWLGT